MKQWSSHNDHDEENTWWLVGENTKKDKYNSKHYDMHMSKVIVCIVAVLHGPLANTPINSDILHRKYTPNNFARILQCWGVLLSWQYPLWSFIHICCPMSLLARLTTAVLINMDDCALNISINVSYIGPHTGMKYRDLLFKELFLGHQDRDLVKILPPTSFLKWHLKFCYS